MKNFKDNYHKLMSELLSGQTKALKFYDNSGDVEEDDDMIPVGGIYISSLSTNPGLPQQAGGLGYGSWSRYHKGKAIVSLDEADDTFNTANADVGSKTSQATFTGSPASTDAVSGGTPSGTNSAPTFTGSSASTNSVSAGTPSGTNSAPTFTGNAMAGHAHELPFQIPATTTTRQIAAATFGTGTSRAATAVSAAGTANTTSAAVALSQSVSAGTPTGTVSAPTFTGSALAGHQHSVTATGSVSAPTFTGDALSAHSHTITPSGTVSAQSVIQPSVSVYVWVRDS